MTQFPFVPAKAGTQGSILKSFNPWPWVPAFAGTNGIESPYSAGCDRGRMS